jgi:hypothetical protein
MMGIVDNDDGWWVWNRLFEAIGPDEKLGGRSKHWRHLAAHFPVTAAVYPLIKLT